MSTTDLYLRMAAVCPGLGAFHHLGERAAWTFEAPTATPQQRAAAQALIDTYDPDAPTVADVTAERDRRLEVFPFGGKLYDFCDGKGSDINIAGAGSLALAAIIAGAQPGNLRWVDPNIDFTWVAADNASTPMDAQTCLAFAQAAAAWKARHIRAARALKDMSAIPADYATDARW